MDFAYFISCISCTSLIMPFLRVEVWMRHLGPIEILVCQFTCLSCQASYIGNTERTLAIKIPPRLTFLHCNNHRIALRSGRKFGDPTTVGVQNKYIMDGWVDEVVRFILPSSGMKTRNRPQQYSTNNHLTTDYTWYVPSGIALEHSIYS